VSTPSEEGGLFKVKLPLMQGDMNATAIASRRAERVARSHGRRRWPWVCAALGFAVLVLGVLSTAEEERLSSFGQQAIDKAADVHHRLRARLGLQSQTANSSSAAAWGTLLTADLGPTPTQTELVTKMEAAASQHNYILAGFLQERLQALGKESASTTAETPATTLARSPEKPSPPADTTAAPPPPATTESPPPSNPPEKPSSPADTTAAPPPPATTESPPPSNPPASLTEGIDETCQRQEDCGEDHYGFACDSNICSTCSFSCKPKITRLIASPAKTGSVLWDHVRFRLVADG
jgi:outer membrane biosynthesis protein TonB